MFALVASLALAVMAPTPVSNVHTIYCTEQNGDLWQGTGWFIRDGVMVTAMHVANHPTCKDGTTGEPVKAYKTDKHHDLALMTGSHGQSVVNYSCDRPVPGRSYTSYGYSSAFPGGNFFDPLPLASDLKATSKRPVLVPNLWNINPYREYKGSILPGMSGGPVTNSNGVALALNNAGTDTTTLLYDLADTALCTKNWD